MYILSEIHTEITKYFICGQNTVNVEKTIELL